MGRRVCAVGLALVVVGCSGGRPSELVGKWSGGGAFGEPGEPGPRWHKDYRLPPDTEVSERSDLNSWAELDGNTLTWQGATYYKQ